MRFLPHKDNTFDSPLINDFKYDKIYDLTNTTPSESLVII